MTVEDWQEIVRWVDARFGAVTWTKEEAVAYYHDLKRYETVDVWQALYNIYNNGVDYPPRGSKLAVETREVMREAARPEQQSLPSSTTDGIGWSQYAMQTYGEHISLGEAVRREMAKGDSP